jgi:hypothetical protein
MYIFVTTVLHKKDTMIKEKGQNEKQLSTKHCRKLKSEQMQTLLKTG